MITLDLDNIKTQEMSAVNNDALNNQNDDSNESNNNVRITRSAHHYIIFQIVGVLLILCVFLWLQHFRGGYSFSETRKVCNWHPLLMTIAFIYLFANSILLFRCFPRTNKRTLKIQHAVIHSCIVVLGGFGIWTGLNSNSISVPSIPQFYSLHSWLGILTVVMFLLLYVSGFVSFFYPGVPLHYKETLMPYHIFCGTLTFVLSIVTSVLGFCEKIIFALDKQQMMSMPVEGLFLNFIGLIVIFYGVLVVYILVNSKYKRPLEPERMPVVDS